MAGQKYRINTPVLGFHYAERGRTPVTIPAGAWVVLENVPADGARMVNVTWDGTAIMMSTADLLERGVQWRDEPFGSRFRS